MCKNTQKVYVDQVKVLFSFTAPYCLEDSREEKFEKDMLLYSFKHGAEIISHLCAEGIILDGSDADDIPKLQGQLEQVLQVMEWRREGLLEPLRDEPEKDGDK